MLLINRDYYKSVIINNNLLFIKYYKYDVLKKAKQLQTRMLSLNAYM